MTTILCISDTHNHDIKLPAADVVVHAGDLTMNGREHEIESALRWYESQPGKVKILVPGNHDFLFEKDPGVARELCERYGIRLLIDDWYVYKGLTFYGSPWQPRFFDWAFNLDRGPDLDEKWQRILPDTDVLITHGPPQGVLDMTTRGEEVGCADLANRICGLNGLKLHVFGHIHGQYGVKPQDGVLYVNASICNEQYRPVNPPVLVHL